MLGRWTLCLPTLILLLGPTAECKAQPASSIAGQTITDMGAAAGSAFAPAWAQDLGYVNEAATGFSLLSQGNYAGFAQQEINARTVDAAQAAGDLAAGPAGGAVAAGLMQGALDIGDLVIAPKLANALVGAFPGVFIPGQASTGVPTNPFGVPPNNTATNISNPAATVSDNSPGDSVFQQPPAATQAMAIPVQSISTPATNSSANIIGQSASNAWLYGLMNNPSNDLSLRKIAAIALGINPDIITSNPVATKLLAAVYGVSLQPNGTASSAAQKATSDPNATSAATISARTQASNSPAIIKTIIPGRQSGSGPGVTVIKPQGQPSSSVVQTIIPGNEPNAGQTRSSTSVIALQSPTTARKSSSNSAASTMVAPPANSMPPEAPPARSAPGGISLTQAAAERLPLNLRLDAAYIKDGRIILSGLENDSGGIDAALFLTALRAACENSDPYFSLDADDIGAWLAETKQAEVDFIGSIKGDISWHIRKDVRRNTPSLLRFRTILASRDYPKLWQSILVKYPDLKSRLVFRPEWLRKTRFGEILYKADVLLKELAGGAPTLGESQFRAAGIDGYQSATERIAALELLDQYNGWKFPDEAQAGGRIWYDLTESSNTIGGSPENIPPGPSELRQLLDQRKLLATSATQSPFQRLSERDGAIDLSDIYPRMFVRAFDPVTHRDSSARFPGLDGLVAQANETPQLYAARYKEYQSLVDVFRAYVVAVRARQMRPSLCLQLPHELLESERTTSILPIYHPTDLAITVGWFEYTDGRLRRAITGPGGLFQGGVSIGVTRFLQNTISSTAPTPILAEFKATLADRKQTFAWRDDAGREYVSLTLDDSAAQKQTAELVTPKAETTHIEPAISGTIGRFDLHEGAKIDGTQLNTVALQSSAANNSSLAENECADLCSNDDECIGFNVDQIRNACTTYSDVFSTHPESNWIHGIWK